mmetsp:Transcript_22129/g.66511  ORF Transcript_22129/g.66511 Transcript_22129/m.66511 type:complete len:311 (+) Transcript_22129:323-1255(+)
MHQPLQKGSADDFAPGLRHSGKGTLPPSTGTLAAAVAISMTICTNFFWRFRRFSSPGGQRWQYLQRLPFLQPPPSLCTHAHGRHWPLAWAVEARDGRRAEPGGATSVRQGSSDSATPSGIPAAAKAPPPTAERVFARPDAKRTCCCRTCSARESWALTRLRRWSSSGPQRWQNSHLSPYRQPSADLCSRAQGLHVPRSCSREPTETGGRLAPGWPPSSGTSPSSGTWTSLALIWAVGHGDPWSVSSSMISPSSHSSSRISPSSSKGGGGRSVDGPGAEARRASFAFALPSALFAKARRASGAEARRASNA